MTVVTDSTLNVHEPDTAPTVAGFLRQHRLSIVAVAVGFVCLFWTTGSNLVRYWGEHGDYSHGFLILPVSIVLLWNDRRELGALRCERSMMGLWVLIGSLVMLLVGVSISIHSLERLSLWGCLIGLTWFTLGGALLRAKPFPFFFLLLAIPPPYFVLEDFRLALKDFATGLASESLLAMGVPALPEGNVLAVGSQRFEVVDACSGIRSLVAITTTAIFVAYLVRAGWLRSILLCACAIPITVLVNIGRLVTVVYVAVRWDIDLATGWAHTTVGFLTYGASLVGLAACWTLISWIVPAGKNAEGGET